MKKILALAAISEAAFGLVLLVYPPIVVRLLFNAEIAGAGIVISRVAGITLIALGVACWPSRDAGSDLFRPLSGLRSYSPLVTLDLIYLGISREWVGILLWPAVAGHVALALPLARAWFKDQHKDTE
jgi:hypothetical protein